MFALFALKLEEECRNEKYSKNLSKKDKKHIIKETETEKISSNDLVVCK